MVDKKQFSHYLRSRVISIHSVISLVAMRISDTKLKTGLEIARDTLIQEQLSRTDLLYYSLLPRTDLMVIVENFSHEGIYNNIHISSLPPKLLAKLGFIINVMTHLADKVEISTEKDMVRWNIHMVDHKDNLLTIHLLAACIEKIFSEVNVDIKNRLWGYELKFSMKGLK